MKTWEDFIEQDLRPEACAFDATSGRIQRFGPLVNEYQALKDEASLVDRDYVGVLEIKGADAAGWLHNLATNQVKNLGRNEGVYAFFLNVQGRIQFDAQIVNLGEVFWCVVNRSFLDKARRHLDKYIITDDVSITDRSRDFVRLGLSGARVGAVLSSIGFAQAGAAAALGVAGCTCADVRITAIRSDFCGVLGVDLYVPRDRAGIVWAELSSERLGARAVPVGDAAVEILRIEAGLPCPLREITDDVLPAETGQLDRAVSYTKGCYLGQEVVERMRTRDVVARVLTGVVLEGDGCPPRGTVLTVSDGAAVGTLTSTCRSIALGAPIGLGYVKHGAAVPGDQLKAVWTDRSAQDKSGEDRTDVARAVALPFVGPPAH